MLRLSLLAATVLVSSLSVLAEEAAKTYPQFTPTGYAQYRFRLASTSSTPDSGDVTKAFNYSNMIGYYVGLKADLSDNVTVQFQLGNDWASTEAVDWASSNKLKDKADKDTVSNKVIDYPFFSLAYARWNAGPVALSAGIIPVKAYGTLDLMEYSLRANKGLYDDAGFTGWLPGTNNALPGVSLEIPILKGAAKLGINSTTSIYNGSGTRIQAKAVDAKKAANAIVEIIDIPLSVGPLTFTPQVVGIFNRWYNSSTESGNHEVGAGFAAAVKAGKAVTVRASFANARNSNTSDASGAHYNTDAAAFATGSLMGLGADVVIGKSKIMLDEKINTAASNAANDSTGVVNIHTDLRYEYSVNKFFSIAPRVRIYTSILPDNNIPGKKTGEFRPEIMITGKF